MTETIGIVRKQIKTDSWMSIKMSLFNISLRGGNMQAGNDMIFNKKLPHLIDWHQMEEAGEGVTAWGQLKN